MSGKSIVICALAAGWSGLVPSVERDCSECGARIVVDVENIRVVISEGRSLVCVNCGIKIVAADPDPQFEGLVGGRTVKGFEDSLKAAAGRIKRRQG